MVRSEATSVPDYLAELPADRRAAIEAVRRCMLDNLDPAFAESMAYGMIGYVVPLDAYPAGYHCNPSQPLPFASLAAQKNHLALYLLGLYVEPDEAARFERAWRAAGKRLDMGKACVRFRRVEDLALDVLAEALRRMPMPRYIAAYEAQLASRGVARKRVKVTAATKGPTPARSAPASAQLRKKVQKK